MIVFYDNLIESDGAILSVSSEYTQLPVSNLLSDRLVEFTRLPSGNQHVLLDLPDEKQIDAVVMAGCNFTAATVQFSDDGFASVKEEHVMSDASEGKLIARFSTVSATNVRVVLSGPGSKNIGKLFIGRTLQMPGMEPAQNIDYSTTRKLALSLSGQAFPGSGYEFKAYEVSFPRITLEQADSILAFWGTVTNQRSFFSYLWGNKDEYLPLFYGVLNQDKLKIERSGYRNKPFKIKLAVMEVF